MTKSGKLILEREALMAALGAVHGEHSGQARMNTKSNLPIRQSPTGGA